MPNYQEGYTTDDNARALIVTMLLEELGGSAAQEVRGLAARYLAFLGYAYNPTTNRFRNFLDYTRQWQEYSGSEDSHGRALWGLGTVLGRSTNPTLRGPAGRLFEQGLPAILETTSPRAWAYALIGIHEYLRRFAGDRTVNQMREVLAERLMEMYRTIQTTDWLWFETSLTYANASLPHALLLCGQWIPNNAMKEAALETLTWLVDRQRAKAGHFIPVGSHGFYPRGGERARFDQQPIEAQVTVSACLEAYRATGDQRWREEARRTFDWFLGYNDLGLPLYDPTTGGCRDGLHPDRTNENQGAESTLAFLSSLLELRLNENILRATDAPLEVNDAPASP